MTEGWDALEQAAPSDPARQELARDFVRTFGGNAGDAVLQHLRVSILDRELPADCPDSVLRHHEGRRSVVREILRMIERGKQ